MPLLCCRVSASRFPEAKMDFYHYSLCHLCKETNPNLKRCVKCKIVHYCSREHQVQDWSAHKSECRLLQIIRRQHIFTPCIDPEAFTLFKMQGAVLLRALMGSHCPQALTDMFLYPKVCAVCFSDSIIGTCDNCLSVGFCSEFHKNVLQIQHSMHCHALKQCLNTFVEAHKKSSLFVDTHLIPVFPEDVETLPRDHNEVVKILKILPENLFESDSLVLSDMIAYATNMINALERCNVVEKRRAKNSKLLVHIVVTEQIVHSDWFFVIEFLAHWILNVKSIKIAFIGRNVPILDKYPAIKCEKCKAAKIKRGFLSFPRDYYNVCRSIPKPDLIVLYDQEIDPMFVYYLASGVPVVMTSLSGITLARNTQFLPGTRVNFVVGAAMNKYASVRPQRNMIEGEPPVFYRHKFATVFTKN